MRSEFIDSIKNNQTSFGLNLTDEQVARLADYYCLIQEHNPLLHLVGPCSPEEFAIRHILESLMLLEHLPQNAKLVDVGAGAGLPSIPCLLVRDDLQALLIESKQKKATFLKTAITDLNLSTRAEIENHQFEEVQAAGCEYVTCRALDKFTEKLPRLIKWSKDCKLLLFGGRNLEKALQQRKLHFKKILLPMSDQRYLLLLKG